MKWSESHSVVSDSLRPHGLYSPWNSPGQNTGVGSLSLLQEIFPTQGLNPGLMHCRQILYQLSHKGSPRMLEWVAYPFSSRSSWPRNQTGVSYIAGEFFNWATTEALRKMSEDQILPCLWEVLWSCLHFRGISVGSVLSTDCRRVRVIRKPLSEPRWEMVVAGPGPQGQCDKCQQNCYWIGWRSEREESLEHLEGWSCHLCLSLTSIFCLQFHCHFSRQAPFIPITVIAFKQILQTSSWEMALFSPGLCKDLVVVNRVCSLAGKTLLPWVITHLCEPPTLAQGFMTSPSWWTCYEGWKAVGYLRSLVWLPLSHHTVPLPLESTFVIYPWRKQTVCLHHCHSAPVSLGNLVPMQVHGPHPRPLSHNRMAGPRNRL